LLAAGADPVAAIDTLQNQSEFQVALTKLQKEANWWRIKHFVVFLHAGSHSLILIISSCNELNFSVFLGGFSSKDWNSQTSSNGASSASMSLRQKIESNVADVGSAGVR